MNISTIKLIICLLSAVALLPQAAAQQGKLRGQVTHNDAPVPSATIELTGTGTITRTDSTGSFAFPGLAAGTYKIRTTASGLLPFVQQVKLAPGETRTINFTLEANTLRGDEAVVTGTLRPVHRLESAVPVEVISAKLFRKNASVCLFDAMSMVNGVQPQVNCNVCNTGDIHINGMEGPYTMVLIDGMPIVSSLATVYGLNGIPNSMVERVELVKGPAAALYGSEAMGGIINVITKNAAKAPRLAADIMGSTWGEINTDVAVKAITGKADVLLGVNYFNYQQPFDKNKDGFTDVTLQNRLSIFNKWNWRRPGNKTASLAARYVFEDRWGGQMQWNKSWRGSDSVYGEQIYTNRWELTGQYQLPTRQRIFTQWSLNGHYQDSYYGSTPYIASQEVFFGQAYWDKPLPKRQHLTLGASFRFTRYDDNTPATATPDGHSSQPEHTPLPGIFLQHEWKPNEKHTLLSGYRLDRHRNHGLIQSPRIAYKYQPATNHTLRLSFGTGFRVVSLFTEDHAALTGARKVVIAETLRPERSVNGNLNYVYKTNLGGTLLTVDMTAFYTRFSNKITGDFDTDPDKIIFSNLKGYAISKGIAVNTDFIWPFGLKIINGISYMNVFQTSTVNKQTTRQLFAPVWSGTTTITHTLPKNWMLDLTARWTGPMRLPVLPNDYRPEYSPWFAIINLQATHKFSERLECYGGIKNLLNFLPKDPIMRPWDPFDRLVNDPVNNPNGYTFDPNYNYAPMQGIRFFTGVRVQVK